MIIFAEVIRTISIVILVFSSAFYLRHLEKTKNKLSIFERTMYIIIQIAYILFAISLLIFVFND
ncbi:hypothetical protein [Oceanobacillus senegalensis]|uniref:hypothetical protein n=1 Tax=Oceanobacillus senegalensis TaxID=1936063 RepID=UPI000A306E0F|nr:hypothetical protein [Oceanobacillus senegalensis]